MTGALPDSIAAGSSLKLAWLGCWPVNPRILVAISHALQPAQAWRVNVEPVTSLNNDPWAGTAKWLQGTS